MVTPAPASAGSRLLAAFEAVAAGHPESADTLAPFYAPDVVFTDPMQTLRGLDPFLEMNRRYLRRARAFEMRFLDVVEDHDLLLATWTMTFALRGGPTMVVEGATRLRFHDGRVVEHRDYWDLLGSLAAMVPGLGRVYRAVVSRLA